LIRRGVFLSTTARHSILETVRVLHQSGSDTDRQDDEDGPLHRICMIRTHYTGWPFRFSLRRSESDEYHFDIICKLIELQLIHTTPPLRVTSRSLSKITFEAAKVIGMQRGLESSPQILGLCNFVLDRLGNTFRHFLLAGASLDELFMSFHSPTKIFLFVGIAQFSSQAGNSKVLILHIVNALSASQLSRLKGLLRTSRISETMAFSREFARSINDALQWLSSVETPSTLMHLSRCVISHSMSFRNLLHYIQPVRLRDEHNRPEDPFNLPEHLYMYILKEDN